jgi:PAS domain S-box-containing protein
MSQPRKPARKAGPSKRGRSRSGSLRARLEEAEETLRAIRSGEVDAVVGSGSEGERIYVLKGADHSYRRFMEQMSQGAGLISTQGICTYANPRLADLLGVPLERLVGSSFDAFVLEEERARFRALVEEDGTVLGGGELSLIKGDGVRVPALISLGKADLDGSVAACLVVTDITERKLVEQRLADAEESLTITLHSIADAMIATDMAGRVTRMNRVAEALTGWTLEEAVSQPLDQVFCTVDQDAHLPLPSPVACVLREAVVAGIGNHVALRAKDGTVRPIAGSGAPILAMGGRIRGVVLVFRDLSAERRTAQARHDAEERLRGEREQMQAQLMFADRMVTMGTLAAGVAHEINGPLAYMTTNLDLLARDLPKLLRALGHTSPEPEELSERVPERLRRVRDGAQRIRTVAGGLKTFSRADGETLARVDLRRVLDASISMAWTEIRHRARLVRDFNDALAVTGNESRLGQVFLNLLTNAAHSIEEGRVDDNEIRVTSGLDRQGRVMVEIRDTGCGIPSGHLSRIFEPFFTSKPIGVGTGLGLAICRSIVDSLGGEITAESRPGVGSAFRVLLPPAPSSPAEETTPSAPALPAGPRARILVIDDEPDMCEAMQEALADHEVVTLTDSRAALQRLLGGEQFDLIFCDLMMPNLTGWELHARLIQAVPEVAERVVFVTGGAFTPRAREYLAQAAVRQLQKPFDLSDLLSLVSRHLCRRA